MTEQRAQAGHERVVGELRIEAAEVQEGSREATADQRKVIAVQYCGMGLAVTAAALNLFEGDGLPKAFALPSALLVLSVFVIWTQNTARRTRIAAIRQADPVGAAVHYRFGSSGIEIQRAAGSKRLSWSECSGFREGPHAFVVFLGRAMPEVVYKRAFREEQLSAIREWLSANVKTVSFWRVFAIALALGFALALMGVVVAIASHNTHH